MTLVQGAVIKLERVFQVSLRCWCPSTGRCPTAGPVGKRGRQERITGIAARTRGMCREAVGIMCRHFGFALLETTRKGALSGLGSGNGTLQGCIARFGRRLVLTLQIRTSRRGAESTGCC